MILGGVNRYVLYPGQACKNRHGTPCHVRQTGHGRPASFHFEVRSLLFHTFHSQADRRAFGGSDFIEIQYCRLPEGTSLQDIVSIDAIENWKNDSLYIFGDDMNLFDQHYGAIITDGVYCNGNRGPMDLCGINFYAGAQAAAMIDRFTEEKPPEYQVLCQWLQAGQQCLGFYVLGV